MIRRPLPAGAGRGENLSPSQSCTDLQRLHLSPLLRGEVAVSSRLCRDDTAGEGSCFPYFWGARAYKVHGWTGLPCFCRTGLATWSWPRRRFTLSARHFPRPNSSPCASRTWPMSSAAIPGSTRSSRPISADRAHSTSLLWPRKFAHLSPDAAILFPNSLRSAITAKLAGCRRIVGFALRPRTALVESTICHDRCTRPLCPFTHHRRLQSTGS